MKETRKVGLSPERLLPPGGEMVAGIALLARPRAAASSPCGQTGAWEAPRGRLGSG